MFGVSESRPPHGGRGMKGRLSYGRGQNNQWYNHRNDTTRHQVQGKESILSHAIYTYTPPLSRRISPYQRISLNIYHLKIQEKRDIYEKEKFDR